MGTISGNRGVAENHAADVLAEASGGVHELRREVDEVAPAGGVDAVAEGGQLQHLGAEVLGVLGVELLRQQPQVLAREPQRLAEVLDDALDGVGRDGAGQHGVLGAEVLVHAADEVVAEGAREVEVDVGEHGHVLGDEPLEGEVPSQRVDVADADEIADEERDAGAAPSAGRTLLEGSFRLHQAPSPP